MRRSLERLRRAGFRLGTLTNSTKATADAQLRNSGLGDLFELTLSADEVGRLKRAAFVARPGMVLDPIHEVPDVVGRDLAEVADGIIAADAGA